MPQGDRPKEEVAAAVAGLQALRKEIASRSGTVAERRKRISEAKRVRSLSWIAALPVQLNHDAAELAWAATPMLAGRHRLTVYDATDLELARRKGLPLARLDEALATAGRAEGSVVLGAT